MVLAALLEDGLPRHVQCVGDLPAFDEDARRGSGSQLRVRRFELKGDVEHSRYRGGGFEKA
jgi:hypothetical protein